MAFELLFRGASTVATVWVWGSVFLILGRRFDIFPPKALDIFHLLWAELRPFYLPAVAVIISKHVMNGDILGWYAITDAAKIYGWWMLKDIGDDDRWKRRRAKVVEKVQRLGSRLVVVPATEGSR